VGQRLGITREAADQFSLRSHQKALAAIQAGKFDEEVVPVPVSFTTPNGSKPKRQEIVFKMDEGPRADTSLEALLALKPVFHAKGTVTAGNSSQTSDGAAAAVVMSAERAKALGIKPLVRYVSFATAGYKPEEMGLGPVFAIPKALKMAGLKLSDIDVIELNEAFAAQALAVMKEAGLDPEKVNPNGGAIALGHPLGCTGAKLTATIIRELKRRNGRYGMVTMCVGGAWGRRGYSRTWRNLPCITKATRFYLFSRLQLRGSLCLALAPEFVFEGISDGHNRSSTQDQNRRRQLSA
jgi:acetyl-CoA acyltransferase